MLISAIPALKDNYIWMVKGAKNQVMVVDPGEALPVLEVLEKNALILSAILITHHHWDHCNGVEKLLENFDIPVYSPSKESVAGTTNPVSEASLVNLPQLNLQLQVLEIPGHTLGHVAYFSPGILFCGDTLFTAGCGKVFEGTPAQMYQSLMRLKALPETTQVYCGHEYTAENLKFAQKVEPQNEAIRKRIGEVIQRRAGNLPTVPAPLALEHLTNPFLRCHVPTVIAAADHYRGKQHRNEVEVFTTLREWKNS